MATIRLKEVAEARGFDISKLSRKADVSYRTTWKLWNNPDANVSLEVLSKFAFALGVNVADLIDEGG
jgi:DNA-binding Xre family transcriptional regulator